MVDETLKVKFRETIVLTWFELKADIYAELSDFAIGKYKADWLFKLIVGCEEFDLFATYIWKPPTDFEVKGFTMGPTVNFI